MRHLAMFVVLSCLSMALHARGKVTGTVRSDDGGCIPYASVFLLRPDSSLAASAMSDSTGVYGLMDVADGDYLLRFAALGYDDRTQPLSVSGDVTVDVVMRRSVAALDEVTVSGRTFIRQEDKLLIIPDKVSVKHAATGYDLLANLMIPGVDVDRRKGQVTRFGKDVALYIDGRKAEYRDVQQLRPQDVERVEYMDVPTGKYARDNAAINYITKKYKAGGYVAVDGLQAIGYLNGDYNAAAKLAHGNTSITLFGGYMRKRSDNHSLKHEDILFPTQLVTRDYTTYDGLTDNNQQYAQLNVENRTDRHNVVVKGSFLRSDSPGDHNASVLTYNGLSENDVQAWDNTTQKSLRPSLTFFGDFKIKENQSLEITAIGNYSDTDYARQYSENGNGTSTQSNEDRYTTYFTAFYNLKLKNKDQFAFMLANFNVFSSVSYTGSVETAQKMRTCESLFLVQYGHSFNDKLSLALLSGISLLNYDIHGGLSSTVPYLRWNSWLNYSISKTQMLLWSINASNMHPWTGYMNGIEQDIDLLQVRRGNPDLKPTKMLASALNYNIQGKKIDGSAMALYQYFGDNTFRDYYIDENRNKLVSTYSTDGNLHQLFLNVSLAWRPSEHFRIKLDGWYSYNRAKGRQQLALHCLNGAMTAAYYWRDLSVNAYIKSRQRSFAQDLSWQDYPFRYGLSVGWHRAGWSIEAGADNLFMTDNKIVNRIDAGVYDCRLDMYDKLNQQSGYVKVAYTIDFGRKTERTVNNVNRNIETSIMTAD